MRNLDMSYYNVYYYCNIIDNLMFYFGNCIDWAPTSAQFTEPFFEAEVKDFSKYSVLHQFCHFALDQLIYEDSQSALADVEERYSNSETVNKDQRLREAFKDDQGNTITLEIDKLLKNFGKDQTELFYTYLKNNDFDFMEDAYSEFCFLNGDVEESIEQLSKELFYILFQNREFLLRFNSYIANANPQRIARKSIPLWVKRAVKFRDKGKCVCCGKDLTGLMDCEDENSVHYDHIVSLDEGGLNDVSNIQLLCKDCNLTKSANSFTASRYKYWYDMDE